MRNLWFIGILLILSSGFLFLEQTQNAFSVLFSPILSDSLELLDSLVIAHGVAAKGSNVPGSTPDTRAPSTVMNDGIPIGVVVPPNFDGVMIYDQAETATSSKYVLVSQVINITPVNGTLGDAPDGFECEGMCDVIFVIHESNVIDAGLPVQELCNLVILHDVNDDGDFDDAGEILDTIITDGGGFPGGSNEKGGTGTSNGLVQCSSDPTTPGSGTGGGGGGGKPKPGFRIRSNDVPSFSKFAIGGIVPLSSGGSTSSSNGGAAPTMKSISFDGISNYNDEGILEFGGILIDKIAPVNNFPTQTVETGRPFDLRLPFYEDNGVGSLQHVAVYFLQGDEKTIYDSQTSIIYEPNSPVSFSDSAGFISNVSTEGIVKSAYSVDVVFGMTFNFSTDEPLDVIVRSWDKHRRSSDIKFNDLILVVPNHKTSLSLDTFLEKTPDWSKSIQNSLTKSTTIFKEDLDDFHITFDMVNGQSVSKHNAIPLWIKNNAHWWSQNEIDNEDFVAAVQYLIDKDVLLVPEIRVISILEPAPTPEIPIWIKSNAEWWANDSISDEEFIQSIQWLIEKRIMTV